MFNHAIVYVPGEPALWIDATLGRDPRPKPPARDDLDEGYEDEAA